MVDVLQNFTTDTLDSNGRQLVWDNQIVAVAYYNATGESWLHGYSEVINPFVNADFSAPTVTGTGPFDAPGPGWYRDDADAVEPPTSAKIDVSKIPVNYKDDLLSKYATLLANSTTAAGTPADVVGDFFIDSSVFTTPPRNVFPQNYSSVPDAVASWATSSGVPGAGAGYITWSFGTTLREVSSFFFDTYSALASARTAAVSNCIGWYEIQVAVSGTGTVDTDYTTVASGVSPYGQIYPVWCECSPTLAKYVRFRFRNNGGSRTTLAKFYAFDQGTTASGMAALLKNNRYATNNVSTTWPAELYQTVDLTGIDRVYLDLVDSTRRYNQSYLSEDSFANVVIDGVRQTTFWNHRADAAFGYMAHSGLSVDTSSFSGDCVFGVRKEFQVYNLTAYSFDAVLLSNVRTTAPWYAESPSTKRSARQEFPAEAVISIDRAGLSIIDVSRNPTSSEAPDPQLWMRFDVGSRKMLQQLPCAVAIRAGGRIYLATCRGLFILDFPANCAYRYDERGAYVRYGLDHRNENHFNRAEMHVAAYDGSNLMPPAWMIHAYCRGTATPVIPENVLYAVAVGESSVFGRFVALGTATGLLIFNDLLEDAGVFYASADKHPVHHVAVAGEAVWYARGEDDAAELCYLATVAGIAEGFSPTQVFRAGTGSIQTTLSGVLDPAVWEVVQEDPNMALSYGSVLSISGAHLRGGSTGLVHRTLVADQSFVATVEARVLAFPGDARGAVRFGVAYDYPGGYPSLWGLDSQGTCRGAFISALNYDSAAGDVVEDDPLTGGRSFGAHWTCQAQQVDGYITRFANFITPSAAGTRFYLGGLSTNDSCFRVQRVVSTRPMLRRDFTARLDVQLKSGYVPVDELAADVTQNPAAFFGLTDNLRVLPASPKTATGGYWVNPAMFCSGDLTYSGSLVYTTGYYNGIGNAAVEAYPTLDANVAPLGATENTGDSAEFREWRIDYNHANDSLAVYIDGQYIRTQVGGTTTQPPYAGLLFGATPATSSYGTKIPRDCFFRNLRVTYPALLEDSKCKYAVEVSDGRGSVFAPLVSYTTYSGVALNPDSTPASSTLVSTAALSDGNLHAGGVSLAQGASAGIGLSTELAVEALYLYDTVSGTSGWYSTAASKRLQVWHSPDNAAWEQAREYNLNQQERTSGVTKIRFSPALKDRFFKVYMVDAAANYKVAGNYTWTISEIQALTISGADFSATDATEDAEFREWRLAYDATTRVATGYIDGVCVSQTPCPDGVVGGRVVLMHDLSPVNSGTSTLFHGEFRNLSVTFPESAPIPAGSISALSAAEQVTGEATHNYTVATATASGVGVLDVERGASPTLPDVYKTYSFEALFGALPAPTSVFLDGAEARNQGLLFVGTGAYSPARYARRFYLPQWVESYGGCGLDGDYYGQDGRAWLYRYGLLPSLAYHPGGNILVYLPMYNAAHFRMLYLTGGRWEQVSRELSARAAGLTGASGAYEMKSDYTPQLMYSAYDDNIWMLVAPTTLVSMNVYSGVSYNAPITQTVSDVGQSDIFLAYILHQQTILYGRQYISFWDIAAAQDRRHPRNWATSAVLWNRLKTQVPWYSGAADSLSGAVYCDYDKCVYFFGQRRANVTDETLFYRYDVDRDLLEYISGGYPDGEPWPITDEYIAEHTPATGLFERATALMYDPKRLRVCIISPSLAAESLFFYYDVVEQQWGYSGETPPHNSLRLWPQMQERPFSGDGRYVANLPAYNSREDTFVFVAHSADPRLYEYVPERNLLDPGFYYLPAVHGLPAEAGPHLHFTRNGSPVAATFATTAAHDRDFYYAGFRTTSEGSFARTVAGGAVMLSGTVSAVAGTCSDRWVSAISVDAARSFDVSAKVACPKFTRAILVNTNGINAQAHFVVGISDGLNHRGTNSTWGAQDTNIYQVLELRAGVSGTYNNGTTPYPFRGHLVYSDGHFRPDTNADNDAWVNQSYTSYGTTSVEFPTEFSDFKEFRLVYDYETDTAEGFIGGVSVGSTKLRRKFHPAGVRFHFGFEAVTDRAADTWAARIKDISITPKAWDRVEDGRLIMSVSGAVGNYYHERWDSTLCSGVDWVYSTDAYLPTNRKFSGYDYIATLAAVGDGHKLTELAALSLGGGVKCIGITGDTTRRHDSTTYAAITPYVWDDLETGQYVISRNVVTDMVEVFAGGSTSPVLSVPYEELPAYKPQHVYYGKVDYALTDLVYDSPTVSGSWTAWPSGAAGLVAAKRAFGGAAQHSYLSAAFSTATFTLAAGLGEVALYAFYVATGYDAARDTPYTVYADAFTTQPATGDALPVYSVDENVNEFGVAASGTTTVRVDQRRLFDGTGTATDRWYSTGSGWVYLGTFVNPTRVVVSNDAHVGTTSAAGFVCADAIGVDVGKRGKSTFDMSIGHVRYQVGQTELTPDPWEPSGLSIIDMETGALMDSYGEYTGPALADGNITAGAPFR